MVTLQGMRFHTRIGVLPHEATLPQSIEIDLTVWRQAGTAGAPIDYRVLYAVAERATGSGPTPYLEDLAQRVVDGALEVAGVAGVRVAVRKPHVMLAGPVGHAEVVLERGRDD